MSGVEAEDSRAPLPPGFCVYTVLLGGYERLNEQPMRNSSGARFICLTDDPELRSDSWEMRFVTPLFPSDPIRSQRDMKVRPYSYLPEFSSSLYIDNSVVLTATPEAIIGEYGFSDGLVLPTHSAKGRVLHEFEAVTRFGMDDPSRIYEQLNHYALDDPDILEEQTYWTAILLRDHTSDAVRRAMEVWIAHILRYSRRDQLSIHMALKAAALTPRTLSIDNNESWFHRWPVTSHRNRKGGNRQASASLKPLLLRLQEQQSEKLQLMAAMAKLEAQNQRLRRVGPGIAPIASAIRRTLSPGRIAKRTASALGLGSKVPAPKRDQPFATTTSGRRLYVARGDQRGRTLIKRGGNLNPPSLAVWSSLIERKPWTHVLDVGANYGEMLLGVEFARSTTLVAVEPNPRIAALLRRSLREARVNAHILEVAISQADGPLLMRFDRKWSGMSRIVDGPGEDGPAHPVQSMTLDALIESQGAPSSIDLLLKIDVEGHELDVLRSGLKRVRELRSFAALVEIMHTSSEDLAWLIDNFDISLWDVGTARLVRVEPNSAEELAALLSSGSYYAQDAVLERK